MAKIIQFNGDKVLIPEDIGFDKNIGNNIYYGLIDEAYFKLIVENTFKLFSLEFISNPLPEWVEELIMTVQSPKMNIPDIEDRKFVRQFLELNYSTSTVEETFIGAFQNLHSVQNILNQRKILKNGFN